MHPRFFSTYKYHSIAGLLLLTGTFVLGRYSAPTQEPPQDVNIMPTSTSDANGNNTIREFKSKNNSFINPILDCRDINSLSNKFIKNLKNDLQSFINQATTQQNITSVSLYFRDLNNGPWLGINEEENFYPASLLKVPVMLSAFNFSEKNPNFLTNKYIYESGDVGATNYFPSPQEIQKGHTYTPEELIESMITNSDNKATALLNTILGKDQIIQTYVALGIDPPIDNNYAITANNYASFFRILYNASYLNYADSTKALKLLSQTAFDQGLRAGVPNTITISHKFGERTMTSNDGTTTNQLHDCGIIYHATHPYILCVMTRGNNFDQLAAFIGQISKLVFKEVNQKDN